MAAKDLRQGDEVEALCADLDDLGAAVAEFPSGGQMLRVHVAGALSGERVRARIAHVSVHARDAGREAWADLVSVLEPSPDRVAAPCPSHGPCGGCDLMSLAYPAQLEAKRRRVLAQLSRHPSLAQLPVDACVASPATTAYRNQAKYVYGRADESGRPVLGAFAPHSHRLIDLAGCCVVEPVLDDVRRKLLAALLGGNVEPFDEQRRTGALRYVVMRATCARQVMVTLVTARAVWPEAQSVAQALAAACPAVVSVVLNVNESAGNAIFGKEERLLWGQAAVEDRIGAVSVRLVSRSFFQSNRWVASSIYRDLVAAAPARVARAVDVYSGAAPIALCLAAISGEVVAIEENPAAAMAAASFIAEQAGVAGRVRMVTGDAARCLADVEAADLVVLNPPRKGCAGPVLQAILRLRPRTLAYLSCDPRTLARDLDVLVAGAARIARIAPYDMMPGTPHVETLAILTF